MSGEDPFLREAERRGLVTAAQAQDCLRIAAALAEVQVELTIDEIAARKGFVTAEQGAEIRRALARLRIGRYEIEDLLGEGAAGVVWRARDTKLDRVVALKVLSQRAQEVPAFRERFAREARIAVTLNHVNIVRGLDYGEADGYQYFAMEFVEGDNAEKRLARTGRLPEKDVVQMGLDVVRALQYVQKFHVVHHDIKPSNLLLTATGHVKLCDLGLAKPMLAEAELMGATGATAGTPFYMSPEQIQHPERVDWKSDVYSLGATLYHLLAGEPVFRGDSKQSVLHKHVNAAPPSPREHVLELSDGVSAVLLRTLQKSPDERYASLDDLAADLELVLAGRDPRHATPASQPEAATAVRHAREDALQRAAETAGARRIPWPTVAVAATLLVAVTAAAMSFSGKKPEPATAAGADPTPPASARPEAPPPKEAAAPAESAPRQESEPRIDLAFEGRAIGEFDARQKRAKALEKDGRFAAACAELDPFPAEFLGSVAARKAAEEVRRIGVAAQAKFDEVAQKAERAAARHRFADAHALLDEAAKIDAPWAETKAKAARVGVEERARRHEKSRVEQAAPFADLYARAILAAGETDVDAARTLVDKEDASLDAFDSEISSLREDLDVLSKSGTDPTTIDGSGVRGATALLLARLAHGSVGEAEIGIEALVKSGGDADEARARIARVRGLLHHRSTMKLDEAETSLADRDVVAAARRVDEALALTPGLPRARMLLGRVRLAQNETDKALTILCDVACLRDAPAEAHLWLGRALKTKGEDLARAETEVERFLAAAPPEETSRAEVESELKDMRARRIAAEVKRWRDVAKVARGKGESAKPELEGALGRVAELLLGDDPEALLGLGQIYFDRKLYPPAYVALTRLKGLPASDAQKKKATEILGRIKGSGFPTDDGQEFAAVADKYLASENWDKAIQHYQAALMVSPHLSAARGKLARAFLARSRDKGAAEDAKAALECATTLATLLPDEAAPLALRAEAQLRLGDMKRALDDATKAVAADPRCAAAQLALGRVSAKQLDFLKGRESFLAANRLDPSPDALIGLARCHQMLGEYEASRGALELVTARYGVLPPALVAEYQELLRGLPTDR